MPNNLVFNRVASQLLTQIYGTDGNNLHGIKTDAYGRLDVVGTFTAVGTITAVTTPTVIELKTDIVNAGGMGTALAVDTSKLRCYSFYVYNLGSSIFKVKLQIAPVNSDAYYIDDVSGEFSIGTGVISRAVLVPRHYLKYTRLQYEAVSGNINAEVWFNGLG